MVILFCYKKWTDKMNDTEKEIYESRMARNI